MIAKMLNFGYNFMAKFNVLLYCSVLFISHEFSVQVKVWFQNRRTKQKKDAHGSGDTTDDLNRQGTSITTMQLSTSVITSRNDVIGGRLSAGQLNSAHSDSIKRGNPLGLLSVVSCGSGLPTGSPEGILSKLASSLSIASSNSFSSGSIYAPEIRTVFPDTNRDLLLTHAQAPQYPVDMSSSERHEVNNFSSAERDFRHLFLRHSGIYPYSNLAQFGAPYYPRPPFQF